MFDNPTARTLVQKINEKFFSSSISKSLALSLENELFKKEYYNRLAISYGFCHFNIIINENETYSSKINIICPSNEKIIHASY